MSAIWQPSSIAEAVWAMAHLKRGSGGHLTKSKTGHLVNGCGQCYSGFCGESVNDACYPSYASDITIAWSGAGMFVVPATGGVPEECTFIYDGGASYSVVISGASSAGLRIRIYTNNTLSVLVAELDTSDVPKGMCIGTAYTVSTGTGTITLLGFTCV